MGPRKSTTSRKCYICNKSVKMQKVADTASHICTKTHKAHRQTKPPLTKELSIKLVRIDEITRTERTTVPLDEKIQPMEQGTNGELLADFERLVGVSSEDKLLVPLTTVSNCRCGNVSCTAPKDDFDEYYDQFLNAKVKARLSAFLKSHGIDIQMDHPDVTIGQIVCRVANFETVINTFYEQLIYGILCPACYLSAHPGQTHKGFKCTKHTAVVVYWEGNFQGGIFVGYTSKLQDKALIQWFDRDMFTVVKIETCYKLSKFDSSVAYATLYNNTKAEAEGANLPLMYLSSK